MKPYYRLLEVVGLADVSEYLLAIKGRQLILRGLMIETRKLKLHPQAIFTFIRAQAGSLGKALSEAVMNSIDAQATCIDITLTARGFKIADNGTGFKSKAEIEAWFETLGFPHDEENHRVYGKFGLGRAQMWAYARTKWYSNEYVMSVDIPATGLDYKLTLQGAPTKGTLIEGEFFEPLAEAQLLGTRMELTALLRFSPQVVTLNGAVLNESIKATNWDFETEDAYFKFDRKYPHLAVYNKGILVGQFPRYRFHATGIIVTKNPLELNIARNEILVQQCPVWKRIIKSMPTAEKQIKEKKPKLDETALIRLGAEVREGRISLQQALEQTPELLTSVHGRAVNAYYLYSVYGNLAPVVFVPKGDKFGKTLSKLKVADVLDIKVLHRFGCASPEEFKELVLQNYDRRLTAEQEDKFRARVWTDKPKEVFGKLVAGYQILSETELTPEQKAVRIAWGKAYTRFRTELTKVIPSEKVNNAFKLTIALGASPEQSSWYNESSNTFVLQAKSVCNEMRRSAPAVQRFAMEQISELLKTFCASTDESKEMFIRLCTATEAPGALVSDLLRFYADACLSLKIPVSQSTVNGISALASGT